MSRSDEDDWSALAATFIVGFLVVAIAQIVKIIVLGVTGAYQRNGSHPALAWAFGLWVLAGAIAVIVGIAGASTLALEVAIFATGAFVATVLLADAAIGQGGFHRSDAIEDVLDPWDESY